MHNRGKALASVAASALAGKAAGAPARIYGANNIKRHLETQKPSYVKATNSLAGQPHEGTREAQRRLRQEERARLKREGAAKA